MFISQQGRFAVALSGALLLGTLLAGCSSAAEIATNRAAAHTGHYGTRPSPSHMMITDDVIHDARVDSGSVSGNHQGTLSGTHFGS